MSAYWIGARGGVEPQLWLTAEKILMFRLAIAPITHTDRSSQTDTHPSRLGMP